MGFGEIPGKSECQGNVGGIFLKFDGIRVLVKCGWNLMSISGFWRNTVRVLEFRGNRLNSHQI